MSKTANNIGVVSAKSVQMGAFHLAASVSFFLLWLDCTRLMRVIKTESSFPFDQSAFIELAAHVPALPMALSEGACLVLMLSIVGLGVCARPPEVPSLNLSNITE